MTDQEASGLAETTGDEPVVPVGRTAEEVELEWRNRLSGKDKAHAAEKQRLEALIQEMTAENQQTKAEAKTKMTDLETLQKQYADIQKELESERKGRAIDNRKAAFPNAAGILSEDILATMDEEGLKGLEQRLATTPMSGEANTPPAPKPVLPNTAARTQDAPPTAEPTIADLKSLLEQQAPAWREELNI